jgi:glycosyltransferase involved in cell wall biosynthesis
MRLGAYADLVYRRDGDRVFADRAFVNFVASLPPRVDELVLFGRLDPEPGRFPYELPTEGVRFVPLPHYPNVRDLPALARALRRSVATFRDELGALDAVWLFGPHPVSLAFARAARRQRVPVALGVRQDFPEYIRSRAPIALPVAHALEAAWRRLARHAPTVVVGEALARKYARGAAVLSTGFSLIRDEQIVVEADALERDWGGELRLLTVGRLSPEKNPLLLPEILARLDERWRLEVIGEGPLRADVEAHAAELGVTSRLELAGYVANGPELWSRYRSAHAFLHVSFTEGVPQVLFEAQASGLPVVATDVGGVRAAVEGSALLVPPADAASASSAVERLREDADERRRLTSAGLANARNETLDAQLDRIAAFFAQQLG